MSRGGVHNALPSGPLSQALARSLGDTVGADGLERYGETLTPILDLWQQPEWYYLRQELIASFQRSQAAVAGEFGAVALVNPTGSNRLYVVERIVVIPASQLQVSIAIALEGTITATLGAVAVTLSVDTRWRDRVTGADRTTGLVYAGSDAVGIAGQVERVISPPGAFTTTQAQTAVPLMLQPGWGVVAIGQTVNVAFEVSVRYRERHALNGELD